MRPLNKKYVEDQSIPNGRISYNFDFDYYYYFYYYYHYYYYAKEDKKENNICEK